MMTVPTLDYATHRLPSHAERIKAIGLHQRNLTLVVLGIVLLHFFTAISLYFFVLQVAGQVYAAVIMFRLVGVLGMTGARKCLTLVGLFVPLVNIVILIVLNYRACEILRGAGLRVGCIGVSEEDLKNYAG